MVTGIAIWGGLVIGAVYMLRAIRNIVHGELSPEWETMRDASFMRKVPFALLTASLLLIGIVPGLLTDKVKGSVEGIVEMATHKPVKKLREFDGTRFAQTEEENR